MLWEETRGTSRAVADDARRVAHVDDAKARTDEASRLPGRSGPKRALVMAGVGVLVVVVAITAVVLLGSDAEPPAAARAAAAEPSPSAEPVELAPAQVLQESQPQGEWRVQSYGREMIQRDGARQRHKEVGEAVTWTIPAGNCTDSGCVGTISSSSGRQIPFVWDGKRFDPNLRGKPDRRPKVACVDDITRAPLPIEESAVIITYTPKFRTFTGSGGRMTMNQTLRVSYEFFGTCDAGPTDPVAYTYEWVLKAKS